MWMGMVLLVLIVGITQLETGQLYQRSIAIVISSEQIVQYHPVPAKMLFLRPMGVSDFNHLLGQ